MMKNNFNNITVGFVGLGLIGGSIARALKARTDCTIMAYSRTRERLIEAKTDGNIDIILNDIGNDFCQCDFIFLCAPVEYNNQYIKQLAPFIKEGCILTDVGSVKTPIHNAAKQFNLENVFIGGHPMAGSEKTGYACSNANLLNGAIYAITPTKETSKEMLSRYISFVEFLNATPLVMDCETHDRSVAGISHVPHIIAASLVNLVQKCDDSFGNMHRMAAGGFKDITRIASSSAEVWQQICACNKKAICTILRQYIDMLTDITDDLEADRFEVISELFESAKKYRSSF